MATRRPKVVLHAGGGEAGGVPLDANELELAREIGNNPEYGRLFDLQAVVRDLVATVDRLDAELRDVAHRKQHPGAPGA